MSLTGTWALILRPHHTYSVCHEPGEWHGRTHTVCVTDDGFEFQGKTYRSLTKIALHITGTQWSGPRFSG